MYDTMSDDPGGPPPGPGGPMPPAPGGGPGGPPGGGGIPPILAALARARMQAQPTQPGMGTQGGAMQKIAMALDLLQQALPALGTGTPHHRAVLKAVTDLSRHAAEGMPQGAQQTALQDMMRNQMRNALLQRIMAQRGGPPAPGMQPSTPMPGA